jgi:hypothetical protein
MNDTKFFKMMGALQFMIAFINFYVAYGAMSELSLLNISIGAICTVAGVFCTVTAARLMGWLK